MALASRTLQDLRDLLAIGSEKAQLPEEHARWLLRWVFIAGFLAQGFVPLFDVVWHLIDDAHRIFYGSTFINIAIGMIWLLALPFVNSVQIRTASWTSILLTAIVGMAQIFLLGGVLSSSVVLMAIPMLLAVIFLTVRDSFVVLVLILAALVGSIYLEQQWGIRGPDLYAAHTEVAYAVVMAQGIVGVWLLLWLGIGLTRLMVRGTQVAKLRAEVSAREKDELVAHISHELRTPLTNILGFVDLLQYQNSGWDRSTMRAVHDNAVTLLTMVNNLLDYSKLQSGGMAFEARACNILEVIAEVSAMHAAPIRRAGNKLIVICEPEEFPEIKVDHDALSRIVSNLISNANKYTETGTITVRIGYELSRVRISIADTGTGMDQETIAHVFEPFYQGTNARPGTGLGLTLVLSLAQRLGGNVSVVSEPGAGSEFVVEIPADADWAAVTTYKTVEASRAQVPEQKAIPAVADKARNASIVFVEDQADIRTMIELFMQSLDVRACIARDWDDLVQRMPPQVDIAFLDLQLPRVDGREAGLLLRKKFPSVTLFAMTANLNFRPDEDSGFDGVLYKPFTMQQLAGILADESQAD